MRRKRKSRQKKPAGRLRNALLLILFLAGAGITFYPVISKTWNRYRDQRLISDYSETVESIPNQEYEAILREAIAYNERHLSNSITDAFSQETGDYTLVNPYASMLNPTGNNVMGYLEIPVINVSLPIYHGISTEVLNKAIGHIEGTSLPVGGAGTHTVLAGHRGLPERKLLTDLDQVKIRDRFYISVLNETLAYEIDRITVVEPHESESLAIEYGQDLATIVTCTPYGVNSHRLLVRGHRVPYSKEEKEMHEKENMTWIGLEEKLLIIGLSVFGIFVLMILLIQKLRGKKRA